MCLEQSYRICIISIKPPYSYFNFKMELKICEQAKIFGQVSKMHAFCPMHQDIFCLKKVYYEASRFWIILNFHFLLLLTKYITGFGCIHICKFKNCNLYLNEELFLQTENIYYHFIKNNTLSMATSQITVFSDF